MIIGSILYKCKNSNITSITIPDTVTSINAFAFTRCHELKEIHIPESVTSICPSAFSQTKWELYHPDEAIIINGILYRYKGSASAFLVPPQVHTICGYAFYGNSTLRQITFSDRVRTLGKTAFCVCGASIRFCIGDACAVIPPVKSWQSLDEERIIEFLIEKDWDEREKLFSNLSRAAHKIPIAVLLLRCHDSNAAKAYIRKNLKRALEYILTQDDSSALSVILEHGMITSRNLEMHLQLAIEKRAMQCQMLLMHRKSETGGYNKDMFRL